MSASIVMSVFFNYMDRLYQA